MYCLDTQALHRSVALPATRNASQGLFCAVEPHSVGCGWEFAPARSSSNLKRTARKKASGCGTRPSLGGSHERADQLFRSPPVHLASPGQSGRKEDQQKTLLPV